MATYGKIKILLTGGGTGGSVSPLLAIVEDLRRHHAVDIGFLFIGTKNGPERHMVEKEKIIFKTVPAGKLRRYFSLKNLIDPFFIIAAMLKSYLIISRYKPDLVIAAGSFVSVPVVWAAWISDKPILIHQQDIRPGLANRMMAPFAKKITVTFKKSLYDYGAKASWTGNPIRRSLEGHSMTSQLSFFFSKESPLPTLLVLGGGTGAEAINELIYKTLPELTQFCRIIHQTGKGKGRHLQLDNYIYFDFMTNHQMSKAYRSADIVVSRCGMGTLTEISYFRKPSILIPMPHSHQEENAAVFRENRAAVVLEEKNLTPQEFLSQIKKLFENKEKQQALSIMIRDVIKPASHHEMLRIINKLLKKTDITQDIVPPDIK